MANKEQELSPEDERLVQESAEELLASLYAKRMKSFQNLSIPPLVYYLIRAYLVGVETIFFVLLFALLNNLCTMWTVRQPRYRHLAAPQYITGLYVLVILVSLCDGMLQSHVLWFVALGPAISCLTMGVRGIKANFVAAIVVVAIPSLAEIYWPDVLLRDHPPAMVLGLRMVALLMLSGFGWLACWHAQRQDAWLEEQNQELETARATVSAAAASKSDFLATMSHEIRTPMNGILGTAQHLVRTPLSADEKGFAQIILDSGRRLLDVLNAILDLSKIEAGKFKLRNASFRLDRAFREVVAEVARSFSAQQLSLSVIGADRPINMQADPSRFEQVLRNLLGSLVSYSQTYPIEVELQAEHDHPQIEIRVPGLILDKHSLATLQEPSAVLASEGTTGQHIALEMQVSHEIAALMGGCLELASSQEFGTVARWELRSTSLQLDTKVSLVSGMDVENSSANIPTLDVLVVDDNAVNLRVACLQLEQLGCVVTLASDGEEAVELCQKNLFSVVFMDLQMPRRTGIEATQDIRRGSGPNVHTPIVAFTANVYDVDLDGLERAGMNGHLAKPFRVAELQRLLRSLDGLGYKKSEDERLCA